ncbi:UDP-N-acetylmuramoyl-L-alanine--D-glutamate ligase [Thermoproteota archaeon]
MIDFQKKNVVVLGLGISGFYCARLLKNLGAKVFVSDRDDGIGQRKYYKELKSLSVDCELGVHTKAFIEQADYLVVSPGIPLNTEAVFWAKRKNIEIVGEMEVAYQHCRAEIIAVTGTNGKTTVTTLIGDILKRAGRRVFILGNIGEPLSARVGDMKEGDLVSLEVSSFQLETTKEFRPKVSLILNITPDHLDRYRDVEEYLDAKKRIFLSQKKDDFIILNYQDDYLKDIANDSQARVVYFNDPKGEIYKNRFNANELAVIKVAEVFGISFNLCVEAFNDFKGIEHRMEFVRTIRGIDFINDSKATNVDATLWALSNSTKPVILIAGGRDKGSDFNSILDIVNDKVKSAILFGEASEKIKHSLSSSIKTSEARDLGEATELAFKEAKSGDCVLLSPMCASFDMFANYKERGESFKEIVSKLSG